MTKFTSLSKIKKAEETFFSQFLHIDGSLSTAMDNPKQYDNVLHIGCTEYYGDVFKCWNDDSDDFILFFGVKGDEFD